MAKYTVSDFLTDARDIIANRGVDEGLEDIRINMEQMLQEPSFLDDNVDLNEHTGFTVVGQDEETDIYVIVHGGKKASSSSPHDHGPCSVIYGNLNNHTVMRRWTRVDDGGDTGPAELEMANEYRVNAGEASAFARGAIHSIEYPDNTYFVRVTVGDVERQHTHMYDVTNSTVRFALRTKE